MDIKLDGYDRNPSFMSIRGVVIKYQGDRGGGKLAGV